MKLSIPQIAALAALSLASCRSLPPAGTAHRQGTIRVEISTGKTLYRTGELLTCTLTPAADCQLTLLVQRADGHRRVIYPNSLEPGSRVFKAGETVTLPGAADPFQFRVTGPVGREQLIARVTSVAGPAGVRGQVLLGNKPGSQPTLSTGGWIKDAGVEGAGNGGFLTDEARVIYDVVK